MITQKLRKENAQGMVEFALVLPLLLLVMFAIIEFGRILFTWSAVFTASREAARYGAAAGSPGDYVPYYRDCAGMEAAARRISNLAGLSSVLISYDHGDGYSVGTCPSNIPAVVSLGDRVRVTVSTTYQPILPLVHIPPIPISSTAARTILKDISISGTPSAPMGSVTVFFESPSSSVDEGDGDTTVTIRLSALFAEDIWIPFSVTGGTATYGTDYTIDTPSPVLMRSGATSVDIHITINNDSMYECGDNVVLTLGTPSNAGVSAPQSHTLTINDDDPPPSVSFTLSAQSINEPNTGSSTTAQVTAQLSAVSGCNVSVPFSTDLSGSTATNGTDYVYDTSSPLSIPAGQLFRQINVRIIGDNMDEDDETVRVVMGTPVNATQGAITAHTVTILDDDLPPFVRFTWDRQDVAEDMHNASIQVELSAASGKTISVPYGLDGDAILGQDYGIQASPLVIAPGLSTVNIPVTLYEDGIEEPDETITVTMGTPTNASLGTPSVHTMVIKSQIEPPEVFFDPGYQEVPESAGSFDVLAQLDRAYYKDVKVPFTIEGTARLGVDYQITTPSPVVIPAGSASTPIHITIVNDTIVEDDEYLKLIMGTPENATPGDPSLHETLIKDDDDPPTVYFTSPSQSGNEAAGTLPVTVSLSNIAGVDVMVPFTVSGSATQGSDYTLSPSTMVTIPAGSLQQTININVINDDQPNGTNVGEPDETVVLTMGTPVNATRGTTYDVHTATITAWVCPTAPSAPYFEAGDSKRLVWGFNYTGVSTLNLAQVTVSWPTHGAVKLDGITFGPAIGASTLYPNFTGSLTVNTPSPLWSGTFADRQMLFLFSQSPDLLSGGISVTARFDHCPVLTGSRSN